MSQNPKKRGGSGRSDGEGLPPHLPDMERAALGCLLLEPTRGLELCAERGARADWFYELPHQVIFHGIGQVAGRLPAETPGDFFVLLVRYLTDSGQLEQVGGLTYLSAVQDSAMSAANLEYHLGLLREQWMRRSLLAASGNLALRIKDSGVATDAALAEALSELEAMSQEAAARAEFPLKHWLPQVIDNIQDYHRGKAQIRGLRTGLDNVDKMLCGLGQENGNMIVLAARPGIGKTSLALQIARYVALEGVWYEPLLDEAGQRRRGPEGEALSKKNVGAPVAIFSLEMSGLSLVDRMVWQQAHADKQRWRTGFATSEDLQPLADATLALAKASIYIDETPRCSVEELVAKARRMVRQYGIKLFVVDYLQLLRSIKRDWSGDRVQELAYISGLFAAVGKTLNVPFLILAQMNRDWEKEAQRPPRLSDLKDSGAIEQDADLVGFIYKPKQNKQQEDEFEEMLEEVYGDDWSKHPVRLNLLWEKNRHGLTGDCWLLFQKSCTRFEDFNVWMKAHGFKESAAGEPKQKALIEDEDVPEGGEQ